MSEEHSQLGHCLNAVLGWFELGNEREAIAELDRIPPRYSEDPHVLDLRWMLLGRQENWTAALAVADRLIQVDPENSAGWLHRAYALRRVPWGGLEKASEVLRPAFDRFPSEPTIRTISHVTPVAWANSMKRATG